MEAPKTAFLGRPRRRGILDIGSSQQLVESIVGLLPIDGIDTCIC